MSCILIDALVPFMIMLPVQDIRSHVSITELPDCQIMMPFATTLVVIQGTQTYELVTNLFA